MTDNDSRDLISRSDTIDRGAMERIIRRAAELQASEREMGDSLTEQQLLDLAKEVGLPARHVRQALVEERNRSIEVTQGALARLIGPDAIVVQRTIPNDASTVMDNLNFWMAERELLIVKRRLKQGMSWETRRDLVAAVRRGLGLGGRRYALARAKEIQGQVRQLEPGWSHVTLTADLTNTRKEHLVGSSAFVLSFGTASLLGFALGVFAPVALLPTVIGIAGGIGIARARRAVVEQIHVALEQVLDGLEHGEAKPPSKKEALPTPGEIGKVLRNEFRRRLRP